MGLIYVFRLIKAQLKYLEQRKRIICVKNAQNPVLTTTFVPGGWNRAGTFAKVAFPGRDSLPARGWGVKGGTRSERRIEVPSVCMC